MRVLVFVGVVFLCNVANAQTWVFHQPTTIATYNPVTASTTYRQCFVIVTYLESVPVIHSALEHGRHIMFQKKQDAVFLKYLILDIKS